MNLREFLNQALMEQAKNWLLISEGGSGKTTSLLESFRYFHSNPQFCCGKRIIPIYVPLAECRSHDDYTIREYIILHYGAADCLPCDSIKSFWKRYETNIFDKQDTAFFYLLMLDAINENYFGENLTEEIRTLSKLCNVRVILTSRTLLAPFKDWMKIKLEALSDSVVESEVESTRLGESILKLLKTPFYLSKYHKLKMAGVDDGFLQHMNAYSLLATYYRWMVDKQISANRTLATDTAVPFAKQETAVCETLLPLLCFAASSHQKMFLDWNDLKIRNEVSKRLKKGKNSEVLVRLISEYGMEHLIDSFIVPLGPITAVDGRYKITHEIYRDFLCAKYMAEHIQNAESISNSNFRCSEDVLNMIANACMGKACFADKNGLVMTTSKEMLQVFFPIDTPEGVQHGFFNYCFIVYNLLESFRNGSNEKEVFCQQFLDISRAFFTKLKICLGAKRLEVKKNHLEIIRIHAEILRRIALYDEAVDVSEYLIQCIRDTALEIDYLMETRHIKIKCSIYAAFDQAKRKTADDQIANSYTKALYELRDLTEEGYPPSANLYAMLLAYPDAISERFVSIYCEKANVRQRRKTAFETNLKSMVAEYKKSTDAVQYHYPMLQCITALLHEDVSCYNKQEDIELFDTEDLISGDILRFGDFCTEKREISLLLAQKLLCYLMQKKNAQILYCLYAKMLLLQGITDKSELLPYLEKSKDQPLSIFMNSLLGKDNDASVIDDISNALEKRAQNRTPDSFDAIYIQEDMKAMWDMFLCNGAEYSKPYCEAVSRLLSLNLRGA